MFSSPPQAQQIWVHLSQAKEKEIRHFAREQQKTRMCSPLTPLWPDVWIYTRQHLLQRTPETDVETDIERPAQLKRILHYCDSC